MNDSGTRILKVVTVFPRDSEALFDDSSTRTFGGATVQIYELSKELAGHGDVRVYSFIPNYPKINFDHSERFNLIKTFNERDPIFLKIHRFHQKLRLIKPDLIITHGLSDFTCFLALYCKIFRINLVYMFASDVECAGHYQRNNKKCLWFRLLINNATFLITQNQHQQNELRRLYQKNSEIMYNGFTILPNDSVKDGSVLWVGRCDPMKKPEQFLTLAEKNPGISFTLICPPGNNQAYYREIKKRADKLPNVSLIDFVRYDRIDPYFSRAKVLINTSEYEGFPQTFIQAAKNATPIISLHVNPDNFITKYDCGFVTTGRLDTMNEKLNILLTDQKTYLRQSDNAYRYAHAYHNISGTVERLLRLVR